MIARAFALTVLLATPLGTILGAQGQPDIVGPEALIAAAQAPAPAPVAPAPQPAPAQGGRAGGPAPAAPPAPPAPPPPPPPGAGRASAPRREGQPVNIRVEATITDQQSGSAPIKKTISVMVADGADGSVRTLSAFQNSSIGVVPLNMDAETTLLPDGKVRLSLRLQYDLPSPVTQARSPGEECQPSKTSITEALNLVLENGKSMVVAQSADPVSDRQVVLEVKATVLR